MLPKRHAGACEVLLDEVHEGDDITQFAQQFDEWLKMLTQQQLTEQMTALQIAITVGRCQNRSRNPHFVEDADNDDQDNPFVEYGPRKRLVVEPP